MRKKLVIRLLASCSSVLLLSHAVQSSADTLINMTGIRIANSIVEVRSAISIVNFITSDEKAELEAKKAEEEKVKKEAEEKEAAEKAKAEAEKAKKEAEEKEAADEAKREDEERIADELKAQETAKTEKLFGLDEFMFRGVVYWSGYKFTYYSEKVLPGGGLRIPGRHTNADGYVSDGEGYIVLAGDAPIGAVFETPFGYKGKIYDRGTSGNHLDVYISR